MKSDLPGRGEGWILSFTVFPLASKKDCQKVRGSLRERLEGAKEKEHW